MTMTQRLGISAFSAISISLIVLGTTSNVEIVLWGISLHIRLAKAIGLMMLLGSIITALVMYGSALAPTRSELERREARANHEPRQETPRAPEKGAWSKSRREAQSTPSHSEWYREQVYSEAA